MMGLKYGSLNDARSHVDGRYNHYTILYTRSHFRLVFQCRRVTITQKSNFYKRSFHLSILSEQASMDGIDTCYIIYLTNGKMPTMQKKDFIYLSRWGTDYRDFICV